MVSFHGMLIDYTRCLAILFEIKLKLTISFKLKSFKKSDQLGFDQKKMHLGFQEL